VKAVTDAEIRLCFDEAQWAVTPGQSVVLYQGDICLGGGIIQGSK
jgi:tRNA-specific 2-thiouridylase